MPPNFQRFLPFILIGFVLLFVLPAVLKKHTSGPSSKTRSALTIQAAVLIDKAEADYKAAHGKYSSHLADLVPLSPKLADDLGGGVVAQLDIGTDGKSYLAQVASDVLSMVRSRTGDAAVTKSCLIVKSGSGVACPVPA